MKAAPYYAPAPIYSWTGFYLGGVGTVGVMGSEHADQWCDVTCSTPVERAWGGGIGGTAGYNWQAGHVLYGIEGDVSWVSSRPIMLSQALIARVFLTARPPAPSGTGTRPSVAAWASL
jgi:opacity protein-like surface antigen